MRVAIVGAGAIGAYLGAKLAAAGEDVTLIARGAQLQALRAQGARVIEPESGGEFTVHPQATDDLGAVRSAEAVFLTVKAHSVTPIAAQLADALAPGAALVTAQNGVPWWYFQRYEGPLAGTHLRTVDPDGAIARTIAPERIVACVVWPATRMVEPGVVEHVEGTRFTLGELDGSETERCRRISQSLERAGLKAPISADIRADIWLKVLGNAVFNPLSALTRATLAQIATDPETRAVSRGAMEEVAAVARALGVELAEWVERRLNGAARVGAHKTSMLQDLESGRTMELEPMVGAPVELGDLLGIQMPHLRTIYACASLLQRQMLGAPA